MNAVFYNYGTLTVDFSGRIRSSESKTSKEHSIPDFNSLVPSPFAWARDYT